MTNHPPKNHTADSTSLDMEAPAQNKSTDEKETALIKALRRIASGDNENRQDQTRPIKRTHGCCK